MKMTSLSKFDLRDFLNRRTYDHALICSFTFDPTFFEEYCLEKLSTFSNNKNISVFIDQSYYEEILQGPESQRPHKANLHYLLYPISVTGVFHPKLVLLASKNKGKLLIGSANLTRSGITSNAELVGVYEYETEKNEQYKLLFQEAFDYILQLSKIYGSENVDSNLNEIIREVDWITSEKKDEKEKNKLLIHNLEEPLWEQLIQGIESPANKVHILSRYFDKYPSLLDKIENDLNPQKIYLYTQNGVTNLTPEWLEHPLVKSGKAEIYLCSYKDNEYLQPLHAKSIAIETGDKCLLAFGSANFSTPALLRTIKSGNAEILIKLPELPLNEFNPQVFFDPGDTAVKLVNSASLQTSKADEEQVIEERKSFEIKLIEATFKDDFEGSKIIIKAGIPIPFRFGEINANLTFNNQITRQFRISHLEDDLYFISLPPNSQRRLNEGSTIIQLEAFDKELLVAQSNILLVTNLKDIKTDKSVRKERHIKEAQQSSTQFLAVLKDLIASNDEAALLTFFNYCDIPLKNYLGRSFFREARPVWDGGAGMKILGEKNLKIYTELHPAVLAFFDRHLKKLQKQVESLDINGIENFLHIFLAMGDILRSQVERAVLGLEFKKSQVTSEEWSDCRNNLDIYFSKFKQLLECLWRQYLTQLLKEYKRTDISEKFLPDFQRVTDLCTDMLSYRERVEKFRLSSLKRINDKGQLVVAGYFHSVLSPEKWNKYAQEVKNDFSNITDAVIVAA